MSKDNLNVYNFAFGTITEQENEIRIDIENDQFSYDNVSSIENHIEQSDERLLPLKSVREGNEYVTLIYQKTEKLKNGIQLKDEEYPIKISIAEKILKEDILGQYAKENIYISINPSTIYYYPMKTVRYTYTGNQFMPREQHTNLERYKACVVSLLSGIAYEKCLNSPNEVKQEGNELLAEIYNQKSIKDLLNLIQSSEDYITYNYITKHEEQYSKKTKWYKVGLGLLAVAGIIGVLSVQLNANDNQVEQAEAYEQEINNKDLQIKGNEAFNQGNYAEATQSLLEAGLEPETVASRLVQAEQYQLALNTNENVLEEVIQHAYNNDKQTILDLNADELSDELSSKLADEKAIIQGDSNTMQNVLNFLDDENTAERLAQAYAETNDMNNLEQIQAKYPDNSTINQIVNEITASQEQQAQRENLQNQINDLEGQLDETEDETEQNELQSQIDELQSELDNFNS
jgi:hypothetical protein